MNYYNNCSKTLQDLCKQIRNTTVTLTSTSKPPLQNAIDEYENSGVNAIGLKLLSPEFWTNIGIISIKNLKGAGLSSNLNLNNKKAKVLFDYEATDSSEISVFANQVRF